MAKTTRTQTTTYAPWVTDFAQGNLAYADYIGSGVMNRYAGGPHNPYAVNAYAYGQPTAFDTHGGFGGNFAPQYSSQYGSQYAPPPAPQPGQPGSWGAVPQTFVAGFSPDTLNAHQMTRTYAAGSTPADIRTIAGDVGGYRAAAAQGLDTSAATNQAIAASIAAMRNAANTPVPTIAPFRPLTPHEVAAQRIAANEVGAVQDVQARQGAEYMNAYLNPYLQNVVEASLADYDTGVGRQAAQARARRDAGAAFGDRAAIADAVFAADSNRGRGTLAAGLRSDAFNTAANFGMQDSNRFLEAERTNQSVAMQRAMENARLQQAAAIANANWAEGADRYNTATRNDFLLTNDSRQRELEQQAFDAALRAASQTASINASAAELAQLQQLNQLKLAQGLTGVAQDQVGLLGTADEAERQRIAALAGVGADIDARNQAVLDEPWKLLQMRADLLNQTPMPTTITEQTKTKKGLLGSLASAVGVASGIKGLFSK